MYSSRAVVRASRVARANAPVVRRNVRFASDSAKTGGSSGALAGGLAGAGAAVGIGYLGYWYSGTKAAVDTATQMKSYMDSAKNQFTVQLKDKTPEVPEAIKALHDMANKYASFVPGGRQYVDKIFKDIDIVREKHGDEVDNIVRELYGELRDVSKSGDLSLTTAGEVWSIFSSHSQKLASLAGDAAQDIMNNHPALKSQLGGSFEQLQQLSDQVGPEAKQKLEDTYKQVSDILAGGIQWNTIEKVHTLVQEKTQDLKKMAEVAFNKGFEQVKPMLEKNPQAKKLIEDNLDTLKNGSVKDLVNQVRSAIESGSTGDLEKYINSAKEKVQSSSSSSISSWLGMIPSGSQIMPQLMKLKEAAEQHGSEAEEIAKATFKDISSVLEKRSAEIEKLVKQAKDKAQEK